MGRSLKFEKVPHNRLRIALANAVGHGITTFGNPKLSADGAADGAGVRQVRSWEFGIRSWGSLRRPIYWPFLS